MGKLHILLTRVFILDNQIEIYHYSVLFWRTDKQGLETLKEDLRIQDPRKGSKENSIVGDDKEEPILENYKEDLINENPKKDPSTEEPKDDTFTKDPHEDHITENSPKDPVTREKLWLVYSCI